MHGSGYTVVAILALIAVVRGQVGTLSLTASNSLNFLYIDNERILNLTNFNNWQAIDIVLKGEYTRLIAIRANNVVQGSCSGILVAGYSVNGQIDIVSDSSWKCSATPQAGWEYLGYDDSSWLPAHQVGRNQGVTPGCSWIPLPDMPNTAYWIWTPSFIDGDMVVTCRGYVDVCGWSEPVCQNGGTCLQNDINLCRCPPRWGGYFCEETINECDSNPCQHDGICELTPDGYACRCGITHTGVNCETDITPCASTPCWNGGTCIFDAEDGGYHCDCPPGYSGDHCETDIDECESEPCWHLGTCIDGANDVQCICYPGFTGQYCQNGIDECASDPCMHDGTCDDLLNGYTCRCHPGYTGERCETPVGNCVDNPCENGGTCTLGGPEGEVECLCPDGWYGPTCTSNADECSSDPCRNGGTCVDGELRFDCECPPAFTGVYCEQVAPGCGSIMKQSQYAPANNWWVLCEINKADNAANVNTPCHELIVDIPYYYNASNILALGGDFGCFPTKVETALVNACVPNYKQDAVLSSCLSCTHMGVCIKVPPPK